MNKDTHSRREAVSWLGRDRRSRWGRKPQVAPLEDAVKGLVGLHVYVAQFHSPSLLAAIREVLPGLKPPRHRERKSGRSFVWARDVTVTVSMALSSIPRLPGHL